MAYAADDAPAESKGDGEAMSDSELASLIDQYVADSGGMWDQPLAKFRERALAYYRGDARGDEIEGRSSVVSRDVAEAVDGMLPDLLEIFVSGNEVVRFDPMGPEDEDAAEQATDYVNWIFSQDNPGFEILYTWFKDALLFKNGMVKVWWESEEHVKDAAYAGLTEDELKLLSSDPSTEIIETTPTVMAADAQAALGGPLFDVKTRQTVPGGRVCVGCIPPEEFMIWSRATGTDNTPFIGQRTQKTKSQLIQEGFDKDIVDGLPSDDEGDDLHGEKLERFKDLTQIPMNNPTLDESMRQVWVEEVFIKADRDGDGIAELRKVTKVNEVILDDTKVDDNWFAMLSPNPMPHTWEGRSIADDTMDIQDIKTAVTRGSLDSLYLSNNPRQLVSDKVNLDDVLNSRPGGVIRVKPNSGPLSENYQAQVTPFVGQSSFPMIEYLDSVIERRTGLIRQAQGMDPDVINKTATAARIMNSAGQRRLKMIARIFAETGVKRVFNLIYACVRKYQQQPKVIRLRNKWVPMDPRGWADKMDLKVSVGLGTGDRTEQLGALMQGIVPAQQALVMMQGGQPKGPFVKPEHLYNTARRIVEYSGIKSPELYFADPDDQANQPPQEAPPPDPKMVEAQGKLQIEQQKAQGQAQLDQQKAQTQIQLQAQQGQADIAMRREMAEQELQLKREELAARLQMERERAVQDYELRRMEMDAEIALKRYQIEKQAETAQATNVPKPE
ncbi:hypothetical protein E9232_004885 [Inquilinus ginsengisoli]|uniref:Portal protein n=1 Tax=Inquilinus ginsengisoli TaxID=363840 RepID=A0ABU1JUP0_9PROT|nr:hypothetical protein [Inquilinus ginsengisoli]MDR6292345.1 hypothetical protein [Inquilinus ginsengisoli]